MLAPRLFAVRTTVIAASVAAVIAVHVVLLAYAAARHSPTIDEVGHLPAGISHWKLQNFALYRVNPPLVRMIAALPVLAATPKLDWTHFSDSPTGRSEFRIGLEFIRINGRRSRWLFTISRWACVPFSIIGAYVCYRWATEAYGTLSGIMAIVLWCFCPNVLAHGQMITPDLPAAAMCVAAAWRFTIWLKRPTMRAALTLGVVLGVVELTKATLIIMFVLWPALWLLIRIRQSARTWLRQGSQLSCCMLVAVYVINAGYGFEGSFQRIGDYEFISRRFADLNSKQGADSPFALISEVPLPLPRNYVRGIDFQANEFERGAPAYLRGQLSHGGWWYYYLYAIVVKVPLGTLALGGLALLVSIFQRTYSVCSEDDAVLLGHGILLLVFVSSQTGINQHLRYALPVFPFAFIWISRIAGAAVMKSTTLAAMVGSLLTCSVASSLAAYPHSLSYFNEAAGGALGGPTHLLDSNIDWGQDLLYLREWLDAHPEARPLHLAYHGYCDPRIYGIEFELPPGVMNDIHHGAQTETESVRLANGWYAVSVNAVYGYRSAIMGPSGERIVLHEPRLAYFRELTPVAYAGRSIYIYHVR